MGDHKNMEGRVRTAAIALVAVAVVALCAVGTIQASKGAEVQGLSAVVAHSAKYERAHQMMRSVHAVLTELAGTSALEKKYGHKVAQGGHGETIFAKTDEKGKLQSVSVAIPAHAGKLQKALAVMHSLEKQLRDVKESTAEISRHWRNKRVPHAPSRLQLQAMQIKKLTRELKEHLEIPLQQKRQLKQLRNLRAGSRSPLVMLTSRPRSTRNISTRSSKIAPLRHSPRELPWINQDR